MPTYSGDDAYVAIAGWQYFCDGYWRSEYEAPDIDTWYEAWWARDLWFFTDEGHSSGLGKWASLTDTGIVLIEDVVISEWHVTNVVPDCPAAVVVNGDTSVLDGLGGPTFENVVPPTGAYPAGTTFDLYGARSYLATTFVMCDSGVYCTDPRMTIRITGSTSPKPPAELDELVPVGPDALIYPDSPVYGPPVAAVTSSGERGFVGISAWIDRMDFDPATHEYVRRDGVWVYFPGGPSATAPQGFSYFASAFEVDGDGRFWMRTAVTSGAVVSQNSQRIWYSAPNITDIDTHGSPVFYGWDSMGGTTMADPQPVRFPYAPSTSNAWPIDGRWMRRAPWNGAVYYAIPSAGGVGGSLVAPAGIWRLTPGSAVQVVDWTRPFFAADATQETREPVQTLEGDIAFLTRHWPTYPSGDFEWRVNFLHPDHTITSHVWTVRAPNASTFRPALIPSRRGGVWAQDNLALDSAAMWNPVQRFTPAGGLVETEITKWLFSGDSNGRTAAADDVSQVLATATLAESGADGNTYQLVYWPQPAIETVWSVGQTVAFEGRV